MDRDNKFWVALAVLFTLANAVAAGFYVRAEPAHGFAHAAAMVFGTWLVWWLATPPMKKQASLMPADERLAQLQQAVDAVAVEVERIGESQRYSAKIQSKREDPRG
jgi:hypothetical protein